MELREPDRDFLRFLWWENEKIQEFRHNQVVFGVTCSPYLLGAVLGYHLSHVPKELKAMANKLQKALYVDNCVTSFSDDNELNEIIVQSIYVLAEANMNLRMWYSSQWSYIPGKLNPADLASRGCTPQQLLRSRWWEGPAFLKGSPEPWPNCEFNVDEESVNSELKKEKVLDLPVKTEVREWFEKFSNISKIIRVLCWVLRFVDNTRKKLKPSSEVLDNLEKKEAEKVLWRMVQRKSFSEKNHSIKKLLVIKDNEGIIRVKTKIIERDDILDFRFPILLPTKHHLTTCLIRQCHLTNCHAGVQIIAAKLRERYWIIAAKQNIRSVVKNCIVRKRFAAKSLTAPPIHLPLDQIRESAVFEITGIDLCGLLFINPKAKVGLFCSLALFIVQYIWIQ
ncbi:hypothetical protein AVEN_144031-1 [Araneus ventricosus]|uniref:Integrase zinc-binding domain-containing protein n=1 Tax=Araneus ventricosus TaxID=182803 RepID=A0A4Y2DGH3_ARAVE|nr:hypothetical protein AVEN_144031-1 [Araneus ventricosus]